MKDLQLIGQQLSLIIVGPIQRFARGFGLVTDTRQSRGEDIEQGCDAGQQEHRRQRYLDDVRDRASGSRYSRSQTLNVCFRKIVVPNKQMLQAGVGSRSRVTTAIADHRGILVCFR